MFDRIRRFFAMRRATEPRHPDVDRLPWPGRTMAGVVITPDTAVQVAAVWACLRFISQTVAMLPWNVMASPLGRGADVQVSHPVQHLLHTRPSPEWSSFQLRETLIHWALRWGNGYAEIERDLAGRPRALWPVHPERTEVCRDPETQELFYRVSNGTGGRVDIPASDIFHLRGFGEGPVGVNVMHYAAQSIGWARAAQLFGASFFGNGANVSGVVLSKRKLEPETLKRMRAEFEKLYAGPRNANRTAFLDADSDWKPTGIDAAKAQLVEANQFLVTEIARWFGVPPHKIADLSRATYSNIEMQSIEVVQDCILPWVRRLEDEADFKLFGQNRQGLFTKIELRGLLRGDFASQTTGLKTLRDIGVINADEIRELLDMNPQPAGAGGNLYTMQKQYVPLDRIGDEPVVTEPDDGEDQAMRDIETMAEESSDA